MRPANGDKKSGLSTFNPFTTPNLEHLSTYIHLANIHPRPHVLLDFPAFRNLPVLGQAVGLAKLHPPVSVCQAHVGVQLGENDCLPMN